MINKYMLSIRGTVICLRNLAVMPEYDLHFPHTIIYQYLTRHSKLILCQLLFQISIINLHNMSDLVLLRKIILLFYICANRLC